jgi:hypothetical protein
MTNDTKYREGGPQSTFHVPPSARSHNGLEIPTVPASCLEAINYQARRTELIALNSPYSCHDGPSFAFTSA